MSRSRTWPRAARGAECASRRRTSCPRRARQPAGAGRSRAPTRCLTRPAACARASSERPRRRTMPVVTATSPRPATSTFPRWTRSLSGSRVCSIPTRRCASVWITEISNDRRTSSTDGDRALASLINPDVRSASERIHRSSAGLARSAPSASTLGAGGFERILRDVDAIKFAIVLAAVLQVIDHLQRRA